MAAIELVHLSKVYGNDVTAVRDLNLEVAEGEFMVLVGPSGCGKTTALRMVAGLEEITSGEIRIAGKVVNDLPPRDRDIAMVFQNYALYPHKNVYENLAFGLRMRKVPKDEQKRRVEEIARILGLGDLLERRPAQLSGGQRQRIALARALAVEPKVLLLDEPFGALDARVRRELRTWLRRLHDEINVSCVFVTHDQEEALEVSDRVAILDAGRIEQVGTPQSVYDNPANPFVYGFLGNVNLFHGRVKEGKATVGDFEVDAPEHRNASDSPAVGYSRPHELEISRDQNGNDSLSAVVLQIQAVGPNVKLRLKRTESEDILEAEITREKLRELDLKPGETVFVKPRLVRVFIADPSETPLNYQI